MMGGSDRKGRSSPRPRRGTEEPPAFLMSDYDQHLFNEGSHFRLYEKLGAHARAAGDRPGTNFAVWAPGAEAVFVMGDFNGWSRDSHPLRCRGNSGVWEGRFEDVGPGGLYKYLIFPRDGGSGLEKSDPFAFHTEVPPRTASVVWPLDYDWGDAEWMGERRRRNSLRSPISIYEVHLGSWRRVPRERGRFLSYRELAPLLAAHVNEGGFTHVEFLPLMEHPFYGSWGYQSTGYFAPSSRYGTPQDFMFLIDHLHRHGIGVILDWVPSHFPNDAHSLGLFDGTHLFEHADPRRGIHPDWDSYIFNYGRHEVRSFLISSALFWLDRYHADGLRVDAVASMLYLDYSRKEGDWIPNPLGGREDLEAIAFLRRLNQEIYGAFPDVQSFAEESTAWPQVSRPVHTGGLGFGFKWDMGWMHDTLMYMSRDAVHRKYHQNEITFRQVYAFTENYVLPLSHDEVVHGKGSLLSRMPGDRWQKLANLRLLLGYMFAQNGKKLLFMGDEFGQWDEWDHEGSLDWHLLEDAMHAGVWRWVQDLNRLYVREPALHELDCDHTGFQWIDFHDSDNSVLSFLRLGAAPQNLVLAVFNFTPVPRADYRVGVPQGGRWEELLNSDAACYGGSGKGNLGTVDAAPAPRHGRPFSLTLTLPPLGALFARYRGTGRSTSPDGS